jgi:TolA-binding protein
MRLVFALLSVLFSLPVFSQNNDEKLAAQYFADKEYAKAADIYEDLARKNQESIYYYDNLLQCYILLKDFKSADKLVDKRIKKFETLYGYRVDKAYLYHLENITDKRDAVFSELLKIKLKSPEEADNLANGFVKRRFYEQAIQTYVNARKDLRNEQLFGFNLSELYFNNNKLQEGTEELVNISGENEYMMQDVKNRLVISYKNRSDYNVLSTVVLTKLQKKPDNLAYNDLLVWAFTQQKDWNGAFIQTKAVDKRLKEDGRKVLELTYILVNNEEYEMAVKCFEYVKSLGTDKRYYYQAQQGMLNCGMLQVRARNGAPLANLRALESEYHQFLGTQGVNWQTAEQIKELSELYIYFLHEPKKGIDQLNRLLSLPGVNTRLAAESKLDLGDAQLIIGETWEADLLYKQVEKSFNTDALGQEAKFRYARLCYFRGDFEWSQTQLDVLKDATTQLISNNAMKLWLIIQDNTGLDSTVDALKLYAQADLLIFQNRLDEASVILDEIPVKFPGHTLIDEIYYAKAVIAEKQEKYADAEIFYLKVIADFSFDILADNALINLAHLYEYKMKDTAKAKKMYENIILNYTGSLFANEARKRFRFLRGDMLQESTDNYWD